MSLAKLSKIPGMRLVASAGQTSLFTCGARWEYNGTLSKRDTSYYEETCRLKAAIVFEAVSLVSPFPHLSDIVCQP